MTSFATSSAVTAGYRADGLRAWKQFNHYAGAERRYFYYDKGNVVLEKSSTGVLKATNTYAPDGLVGRAWSGQNRYFLFDWQGNVANIMSSTATLKSSWGFNAWGFANAISPYSLDVTWDDCFGFNARWGYLKEYGFSTAQTTRVVYLCQNRYYMANEGRWLTRDPISYSGGINLYGYCGGGPILSVDPTGKIAAVLAAPMVMNPVGLAVVGGVLVGTAIMVIGGEIVELIREEVEPCPDVNTDTDYPPTWWPYPDGPSKPAQKPDPNWRNPFESQPTLDPIAPSEDPDWDICEVYARLINDEFDGLLDVADLTEECMRNRFEFMVKWNHIIGK
jgi:RHS repeat-associated protein